MLAVAYQRAYALSLLELPLATADDRDGVELPVADALADAQASKPVALSRLPAPGQAC